MAAPAKRRVRFRRWILGVFLIVGLGLLWLNGPGLRYIVPRVVAHFLQKAGMRGNIEVAGSLTGGLSFSDLRIETDATLATLTIDRVVPDYQLGGLLKGELRGLTVDGLHADLRLGVEKENEPESPPLDLRKLVETIRSSRSRVMPLRLDLTNISLAATRDGIPRFALAPSAIRHAPGSNAIELDLGVLTDATGRDWEARRSTVLWNEDDLSIQRLDPLPGVSLRDFVMRIPAGGEPSVDANVHVDDAVFVLGASPGLASATVDLRSGSLRVEETVRRFGIDLPAKANLTSLAIEVNGILPDPEAATGNLRISVDDVAWKDWAAPELSLDARLGEGDASIVSRGLILGTAVSLEATAPVARVDGGFSISGLTGKFNLADIPALLRELAPRVSAIDPAAPVPPSSVDGGFTVAMRDNKPVSAEVDLTLKPRDPALASSVGVKGRWAPDQPVTADLVIDGLKAALSYQIEPATYQGSLVLEGFTSTRIDPWLAVARIKPGGVAGLSGRWSGTGAVKTGSHTGEVAFTEATWTRGDAMPVTAIGGAKYDWPGGFETQGLRLGMNGQSVAVDARLTDGLLELRRFLWSDGKGELAEGTASLPVPRDFSEWKRTLTDDARPLAVTINTRVLSMGLLKDWMPALEKLDPRSTGRLQLDISGTYAEPVIAARMEARDLRSPTHPGLPPADLRIELAASENRMTLTGEATAPDFAPAELRASMPFRPAEWAEDPALLMEEPLEARVDLPRLDISRFASLVPGIGKLTGVLTGKVEVAGNPSKPAIKGDIDLSGAGFQFKDGRFPAVESAGARVEFGLERVELKNLNATIAGGTLQGSGAVAIANGKPGDISLRIQGDHLPVLRNDLLILRVNADLRLEGVWERAVLTGTVGVVDSIFYRDIELLPIGAPFTGPAAAALPKIDPADKAAAALPQPFGSWGINVTVRTEDAVLVRGNLANGEVTGNMRVGGTFSAPAPDGAFVIKDFKAVLPFSTLSVKSGTLTFKPASGFDPVLEIRGTAEPRPYLVTVFVYGRASNPQLVLTSNPPMPENEIMTLLATGTTTTGLENPQAASSRALQLLAEEMRRGRFRFGKQLRPLLGLLDKVDFSLSEADPYSSDSFSTATIALTDRWFVSAGVGATGDSRFLAIWRISFK